MMQNTPNFVSVFSIPPGAFSDAIFVEKASHGLGLQNKRCIYFRYQL